MLVKDLLNTEFEPAYTDDTVGEVLTLLESYNSDVIPLVDRDGRILLGILSGQILREQMSDQDPIPTSRLLPFRAYPGQQLFEAAGMMIRNKIKFLPVTDLGNHYLGVLKKRQVFDGLFQMLNITEVGSMVTVEVTQRDYVLSDIIRIIEIEGAKILGVIVETPTDMEGNIRISIKMNLTEISAITSSLKRHEYVVTAESRDELTETEYEQRADEFLRYLEI